MTGKRKIKKLNRKIYLIPSILFILVLTFFACDKRNKQNKKAEIDKDTIVNLQITNLANLPDSVKPKQIFLDNSSKPVIINSPAKPGSSYIGLTRSGTQKIQLLSPSIYSFIDTLTHLPIVPDAQGKCFFTTYTTDNGLSLDGLNCSYKDKKGNIWFGTNGGGVSKYDGKDFTNYTTAHGLANNVIWSITEDKTGNLWFGTDGGGVSRYDGKEFITYTTVQGLTNNIVYCITEDKNGNLWFGTFGGGVSKYDGKFFKNFTTSQGLAFNAVRSILEDKNGNLWFGTLGGGVSKYDGKMFTNYTTIQGLANNTVRSIIQDKAGNIWFGTFGGGVSKYTEKGFTSYTTNQGLANNSVRIISEDKSGNLWFGTDGGVSKYDGKNFTNYTTAQGLANNLVRSISEDKSGNLWFGTFGGGVSKYEGKSFTNYTTVPVLAYNQVFSITEDKTGDLWFGTSGGGVSKYDGRNFTNYTTAQGLANNSVYSIKKDRKGNLWFGTSGGGISKYDGKSFTNYTTAQGLVNNIVFSITEDKKGNLWFGTSGGGVSKYDGKSFTNYTTAQGLANNIVYCITEDKIGNLWFGTFGGGVSKYDGKSFTNYTMAQGLANNVIWCITEDKRGNLWFGTQGGLSLFQKEVLAGISKKGGRKESYPGKLFNSYTTQQGLPDNFVTQVMQGDKDKLYIGTNLGICEWIIKNNLHGQNIDWKPGKIFNSRTGYPVKDVNTGPGAMFKDGKGIIWIATGSTKTGLVRFDPKETININSSPPDVVIQSVKINNENICWNDLVSKKGDLNLNKSAAAKSITEEVNTFGRELTNTERDSMLHKFGDIQFDSIAKWYPLPQNLVLQHKHNEISFEFNAIETGKNHLVNYQYMLDGYDKDWSPPSNKSSASFGNIYEGDYTFKLKAESPEGVWSEPITYTFKVIPPWWRTWWMHTFYVILTIAFFILFIWWNSRRLILQKKILQHKINLATNQIREEKNKVQEQKEKIEETLAELKTTQVQLIHSEKMASLGELTAGIAHEIKNPLNFVINFSEVSKELLDEMKIELDNNNSDEAKNIANEVIQNVEKINFHGKRADSIVKAMLQHSRSSNNIKEPTDINVLADEYVRLSYQGLKAKDKSFNSTLEINFDENLGKINIVPQDIGRVILNLLTNAFYAVNEKKKLNITGYKPVVSVSTKRKGDKIEIRISDNGIGIPQKVVDKIFQPFFTTKPAGQGTGLGLSLSYEIITKGHGGELKVETKEGEGSIFIIILFS